MSEIIRTPDGAVREIMSRRTPNAKVFDMGGGHRRMLVAQQRVHYDDAGTLRTVQSGFAREPGLYTFRSNVYGLEIDDDQPQFRLMLRAGGVLQARLTRANGTPITGTFVSTVDTDGLRVRWANVVAGVDQILDFGSGSVHFPVYVTAGAGPMEFVWEATTPDIALFAHSADDRHVENIFRADTSRVSWDLVRPANVATVTNTRRVGGNDRMRVTKTWNGQVGVRDPVTRIRAWSSRPADISHPIRIGGI